jgi:tetratricopeptide (TPR) repeat protein
MPGAAKAERPFIGRPEAVDALRRRSDAARGGRGGLTVLEGEAGVGKSTLVEGLLQEARAKGLRVLTARAPSLENPPPYYLIREALASPGEESESALSSVPPLAFIPTAVRSDLGAAGEAVAHGTESWLVEDRLIEPFGGGGEISAGGRPRMDSELASDLLASGNDGPTLVVLDDVHLADDASLDVLSILAPQLATNPLWVVLSRLPLSALTGPRRARIESIERAGEAERIVVRPFSLAETTEFIRSVDRGTEVRDDEVTRWYSQSGGNPMFLEQLALRRRAVRAEGPPVHRRGTPEEFAEYLASQLGALPQEQERVLAVASVLGREFPFALLLRASGEEEEALAELVQDLVTHGLLRERPEEILEFLRDDLRLTVYHRLTEARRRLLHKKAAEALEAYAPAVEATIYALARHYHLGRVDEKSASYNRLAAELAARAFAPEVSRAHYDRAIESQRRVRPRDPVTELEMALELAVQLDRLGELETAESVLQGILPSAESPLVPPSLRIIARISLARIYSDQGRWDEVDRITAELLPVVDATWSPRTRLALHRLRGELLYFYGRYPESLEQHDQALAIARAQHDQREVALETVRRANVLGMIPGRFEEAIADYKRVCRELIDRGDLSEAAYTLIYLGVVLSWYGRTDEGLASLAEARGLAEKAGDARRLGWALFNIADLERDRGNLDAARPANQRAREILEKVGDRFGVVQTQIVEGKILLDSGNLAAAQTELLEAYRMVRELNIPADEAEVVLRLAELALARGDRASAETREHELGRLGIDRLRPDLLQDHRRFVDRLRAGGEAAAE